MTCPRCPERAACPYRGKTFRCRVCGRDRPWCQGASDDRPGTCDECVARRELGKGRGRGVRKEAGR